MDRGFHLPGMEELRQASADVAIYALKARLSGPVDDLHVEVGQKHHGPHLTPYVLHETMYTVLNGLQPA